MIGVTCKSEKVFYTRRNSAWKTRVALLKEKKDIKSLGTEMKSLSITPTLKNTPTPTKMCVEDNCIKSACKKPSDITIRTKKNEVYCESHWYAIQAWKLYIYRKIDSISIAKRIRDGEGAYFAGRVYLPKCSHGILLEEVSEMLRSRKQKPEKLIKEKEEGKDILGGVDYPDEGGMDDDE